MNIGIGKFLRDGLTQDSIEQAFRRVVAAVLAGFQIQHKDDGKHSDITADSVTVTPRADFELTGFEWDVPTGRLGLIAQEDGGIPQRYLEINSTWEGSGNRAAFVQIVALHAPSGSASSSTATILANAHTTSTIALIADQVTIAGANAILLVGQISLTGDLIVTGLVSATSGFKERSRSTAMGEWTTPSFNAANFTGSGTITWTVASGDVSTYQYTLVGKTMTVNFSIDTTSVSGTGTELRIAIPGGFTSAKLMNIPIRVSDNGTLAIGYCRVVASGTVIACFADVSGATNWAAAADTTFVRGSITFEVQ